MKYKKDNIKKKKEVSVLNRLWAIWILKQQNSMLF